MKKILFLLLLSVTVFSQQTNFPYGIKNNADSENSTPTYFVTKEVDGVHKKTPAATVAMKIDLDKKQFLSTGLIKNGLITINADPIKYNISAGIGIITNFDNPEIPVCTIVNFPATTGKTPTYLNTRNITYVAINSSGVVVEQATAFTTTQRRDLIILGAVIHSNLTTINVVNNISAPTNADTNQLQDLMTYIGALNLTGNKYTANGANLSLDKSAGSIFKAGVNFATDWKRPHELDQAAGVALTFRYRTQNGTESGDLTTLNPAVYDLSNVLTSVPSNKFTIQTVTMFQTGLTRIQYGQSYYNTLEEAQNAILTRNYVVESNIAMNGLTRAYIILRNTTTSLQNAADAKIVEAQKFGGVASGGVALTDTAIIAALGYTPANDTDVVKLTGNQTIAGEKTFTGGLRMDSLFLKGLSTYTFDDTAGDYTIATKTDVQGAINDIIKPVTETGTSFSLTDAYNGKVVIFTGSCTVTIPNGLAANFECSFVTLTGVTLTVATGGSVVLHNNVGTTLAEKLSVTIKQRTTANNYITVGNL